MSAQFSTPTDELLLLAETLGEVKSRTEKLETEFSTQARPLEAATNALSAALSGIKALQFHVLDNNLGALSARVEEMRKAVDEQVGVIALELKKADETNAAKAGADAEALRSEIVALQSQLGSLVTQFGQQLERVEFEAKEEAKKLQLIPGPAGAAGASLNPRGTFIDGETYNRLDVVSWLGSSYIATVDDVTEKPSKNSNQWQTLASRGGGGAGGVGDFGSLAGVAQINQGGTGQTTRVAALNALLPDQAGSTQYMLLTDGSGTVSWGAQPVAGLPSQTSNGGRLLTTNGTTASWSNAVTVSGSNATVGGTLTVSGSGTTAIGGMVKGAAATYSLNPPTGVSPGFQVDVENATTRDVISFGDTSRAGLLRGYHDGSGGINWRFGRYSGGAYDEFVRLAGSTAASAVLTIYGTTASTSTSSGALVVGNGTSGGLGVGGAINAGSTIAATSNITSYAKLVTDRIAAANGVVVEAIKADIGTDATLGALTVGIGGVSSATGASRYGYFGAGDNGAWRTLYLGSNTAAGGGRIFIPSTESSTGTSSGALVVSGGVGVAKSINAGENGASHSFQGGDGGSGSTILAIKDYAGSTKVNIDGVGGVGISASLVLSGSSNVFRISNAQTPASATATGTAGTIAWDTSYIYVCTATNTWKRVAISTW